MRTWFARIGILAVIALACCLVGEAGAAGSRTFAGSVSAGLIERVFEMPGRQARADRYSDKRDRRFVPSHYGEVFQITAHGEDAILWMKDEAGVVRNVRITGANQKLLVIEKRTSRVLQVRE